MLRLHNKNLPGLLMLVAGFASGVVVTLMFGGHRPAILQPAGTTLSSSVSGRMLTLDYRNKLSKCISEKEADEIKRLAHITFVRSQLSTNRTHIRYNVPSLTAQNITDLKRFLYPGTSNLSPGIPLGVPNLLKQEYLIKDPLLIGILTQQEYLHTRAQAVYETWAQDIIEGDVVFFVGEDCEISANLSHLPIIKLDGIPDHVYPPLKKAFAVMQYMYDNFINQYNWFIRADDDMYVRGELLTNLLKRMSPYERVYLGRAGVGKGDDLDRLHLLPHERYCMGGPGVVFSNAAMRAVGPHLNQCLSAVFLHDQHSSQKWNDDDVEIGRCISRKLDFQCSTSAESRLRFHTDYTGDSLHPLTLWSKPIFREVVSMHPVKDPRNMHAIHHFYKTLEFERRYEELFNLMESTNKLCHDLPNHLMPPGFLSTGCNLKLSHRDDREYIGSASTFLINSSSTISTNPTDIYDETQWKFFDRSMIYDVAGISPRRPLTLSLQAELNHLQKLLRSYFSRRVETKDYIMDEIVYGNTRLLPTTGREFKLRVKLTHKENQRTSKYIIVKTLQRLSQDIAISSDVMNRRPIHVLLPLMVVDDRFKEFVRNFVKQGLSKGITLSLVVVLFNELDADLVEGIVKQFTRGFPKAVVTIAISEGQYSLPHAVEMGMSVLKDNNNDDVVFVTDVNVRVKNDFWSRCRDNAILKKQVYFPIPFSVYVSDYRTQLINDTTGHPINRWSGQWALYSFKNFCIVKSDYDNIGSDDGVKFSVDFFERLIRSNLQIFQSPDPSLYRMWPTRTCENLDSPTKKNVCLELMKISKEFPQTELTEYLIGLDKNKITKFWYNNGS